MLTDDNVHHTPQRFKKAPPKKTTTTVDDENKPAKNEPEMIRRNLGRFRGLARAHPIYELRMEVHAAAKRTERIVLRQILAAFRALPPLEEIKTWTQHQAEHEAERLGAHIQWIRCNHALLNMSPTDKNYLMVSKATSLWMANRLKLNKASKIHSANGNQRKSVPVSRAAPPASATEDDEEPL